MAPAWLWVFMVMRKADIAGGWPNELGMPKNWLDEPVRIVNPVTWLDPARLGFGNVPVGSSSATSTNHDDPPVDMTANPNCIGLVGYQLAICQLVAPVDVSVTYRGCTLSPYSWPPEGPTCADENG